MINDAALLPKPTLTGRHLRLVPLTVRHAEHFWHATQDPEIRRLTGARREFTLAEIEEWCTTRADQPDRLDLAVEDLDGGYLGELALIDLDRDNRSAAFRIALVPTATGRGPGTEAIGLLLDHAFTAIGLHRVHLEVYDLNPRAQRAYQKAGFTLEGRLRESHHWDGHWHDTLLMAALSTEHRAATPTPAAT
ncbi:GNAT family N-acetyltransferase [Kitasatospora sp. NPDC101801]|uniref:GNAT family N-acetyltransferase n=1 Tax=Kitasatospora sp. NPDC101801 TaxID=3364103 RepID=UPI003828CB82